MKVVCKVCRKKFDYDVYMGLCPKCGNYFREGMGSSEQALHSQETEVQKRYDDHREREERMEALEQAFQRMTQPTVNSQSGSRQQARGSQPTGQGQSARANGQRSQQSHQQNPGNAGRCYHGVSKEHRKEAGKKSSAVKIVVAVIVVFMLISTVLPIAIANYSQRKVQKLVQEEVDTNAVSQKKSFSYKAEEANYEITITEVKADKGTWFGLPKGYEMIVLKYHIDTDNDSEVRTGNQIFSDVHMKPYLITKSGEYLTPCYTSDIASKKGWDYDEEAEEGLSNQFWYKDGVMFFVVQKKQAKGLFVNSYNFNEEEYDETTVRESFLIEKMEVER